MADKEKSSVKEKKKKSRQLIFRRFGKYFLILVLVLGQGYTAYSIVNKNFDEIYGYLQQLSPQETGQFELEKIIVNPANTNGQRYLLVQLSLELVSKEDQKLIEKNRSKIRNNLINYLSAKTVSQLEGIKDKEDLRLELAKVINKTIGSRSVRNLYYSKYVMQ